MLRTLLIALVVATAAVACGSGSGSGPAVVAGAPAGDVTELGGTVTATRDGATRTLAVGDAVSGDDVIETGADGRVVIQLRHNLVPWTLGAGKKEQVATSLAWKAPRATQTAAGPTAERSGAAGRHAEREAADTAATAAAPPAAAAPPMPAEESDDEAPARAEEVAARDEVAAAAMEEAREIAMKSEEKAMKSEEKAVARRGGAGGGGGANGKIVLDEDLGDPLAGLSGGLGVSGAGSGGGGTGEGTIGLGSVGTIGKGGGAGDSYGAGTGARGAPRKPASAGIVRVFSSKGGLDNAVVLRVMRSRTARFTACIKAEAPARATVKATIGIDGAVSAVTVAGVSSGASACIQKWMKATQFPAATAPTTTSVLIQN
jgi:hypothetical protein